MSASAATLLASLVGVFGVIVGLTFERLMRSCGKLWCTPSKSGGLRFMGDDPRGEEYGEVAMVPDKANKVKYSYNLDLFNGKEIPVGLRDITVEFLCEDGKLTHKPWDSTTGIYSLGLTTLAKLEIANFAPRQWVRLELHGSFNTSDDVRRLAGWRKVNFVGQRHRRGLFERKVYRKTIDTRTNHQNV